MTRIARLVSLALIATLSASALACGVCIEDTVAATYDHALVTSALAKHQLVVFGAIEGSVDMKAATNRIVRAAPQVRGIDRRSIRTSLAPSGFSFALDPAAQDADSAVADLQKRLQVPGLKLGVLRVMSNDAQSARNKDGRSRRLPQ